MFRMKRTLLFSRFLLTDLPQAAKIKRGLPKFPFWKTSSASVLMNYLTHKHNCPYPVGKVVLTLIVLLMG